MKTSIALWAAGLLAVGLSHAQDKPIYKSIAADGSVVFTDKPAPNATVITPAPLNIMDSTAPEADELPIADEQAVEQVEPETANISEVTIVSPQNELTLIDPEGPIWVDIEISPAKTLPQGYSAEIRLNGELVVSGWSTSLPMDIPERGSHRLKASILNAEGAVLAESDEIEIYIQQRVELSGDVQ